MNELVPYREQDVIDVEVLASKPPKKEKWIWTVVSAATLGILVGMLLLILS